MKFNHILSGLALSAAVLAAGCQKSLEYSDVVYFTGTENSNITNMYVDGPSSMGVTVTSSCKMAADVQVSLAVDAAAVDAYNALHGTDYRMLPAGSYRLSDEAVTIAEGTNVSTPSSFEIVSMDDFDEGANYCVPLKITGTSNGMGVLEASRTQYIFISQITTTRGINLKNSWYITMDGMVDDPALKDLPACTMEIRMYANGWRTSGHMISSLIGVEENFLLRVGDESIKNPAQLQLAGRGTSITAPNALSLGRWYHIAVVDNGSEMTIYIDGNAEISVDSSSSKAINLGFYYNSPFAIGMSAADVRYFNGYVSEARTQEQPVLRRSDDGRRTYRLLASGSGRRRRKDVCRSLRQRLSRQGFVESHMDRRNQMPRHRVIRINRRVGRPLFRRPPATLKNSKLMRMFKAMALTAAILAPLLAPAANPRLLHFEEPVKNLGKVAETDGTVKLRFEYTNIADREVTLLDVHTQCGCARPEFSRKPVKPGGKGTVEVTFDPKDRYGDFSIGLTVIAGNGNYRKFNTLVVKGYVISRIPEAEIRYPYALSAALRADNRAIGMRQLSRSDPKRTRQLRLLNTSAKTLRLAYRTDSGHLALSGPGEIAPGKEAVLEFTLDPRNMPDGQFVLKCTVSTQDEEIPVEVKGQIVGR